MEHFQPYIQRQFDTELDSVSKVSESLYLCIMLNVEFTVQSIVCNEFGWDTVLEQCVCSLKGKCQDVSSLLPRAVLFWSVHFQHYVHNTYTMCIAKCFPSIWECGCLQQLHLLFWNIFWPACWTLRLSPFLFIIWLSEPPALCFGVFPPSRSSLFLFLLNCTLSCLAESRETLPGRAVWV